MAKDKMLFFILAIAVVAALLAFGLNLIKPDNVTGIFSNQKEASAKVEKLYELVNPSVDATVVKIDDVNGLYKVLVKAVDASGTVTYREAYVTKDGELMTENMIIVSQSIDRISKMNKFIDCLDGENVRIFGIVNETGTALQFNILGGSYAVKLYGSCDGDRAQECVNVGITQVPTTVYQGKGYAGVQSVATLQNLTGCTL